MHRIGIVIPFFDRRELVIKCLESLAASQIPENVTFYFVLDYGSKNVDDLFQDCPLERTIIQHRATTHQNIFGCLKTGWDYFFDNGFDVLGNLDSDVIVKPDWLTRIIDLQKRMPGHIVTGFNTSTHEHFAERDDYLLKKTAGGCNFLFSRHLYPTIRPCLDSFEWDWKVCRTIDVPIVVAKPSVIQHLGVRDNRRTDIADDFDARPAGSIVPNFAEKCIYPPFYMGKISVIMPCRNRNHDLRKALPYWLSQNYQRFDMIIVDYNSETPVYNSIWQIAEKFGASINLSKEVSASAYDKYSKITVLRLDNLDQWNMSHALNYGIRHSTSDIVSIAGCDTTPDPAYLEIVATCTTENIVASVWCGRISFKRSRWHEINGYQEMCVNWGAEDTDFRLRLSATGSTLWELNPNLCPAIAHPNIRLQDKGLFNLYRCNDYRDQHGCIGNYTLTPGNEQPLTTTGLYENTIFFAKTNRPVMPQYITKRCCYAGKIDDVTYYYIVPSVAADENIFSEEILANLDRTWSSQTFKSVWHIMADPSQWM